MSAIEDENRGIMMTLGVQDWEMILAALEDKASANNDVEIANLARVIKDVLIVEGVRDDQTERTR